MRVTQRRQRAAGRRPRTCVRSLCARARTSRSMARCAAASVRAGAFCRIARADLVARPRSDTSMCPSSPPVRSQSPMATTTARSETSFTRSSTKDAARWRRRSARSCARPGAICLTEASCAVPVPLHPWRRLQRGFNQAADLAAALNASRRACAVATPNDAAADRSRRQVRGGGTCAARFACRRWSATAR